jgi:hypothetical protein
MRSWPRWSVPAVRNTPDNGHIDFTTEAVRHALQALSGRLPGGQVLPAEELCARVAALIKAYSRCDPMATLGPPCSL